MNLNEMSGSLTRQLSPVTCHIWHYNIAQKNKNLFQTYLQELPKSLQKEILSINANQAQWHKLIGRLLLKKALHFTGYSTDLLQEIAYGYNGKPYIPTWQSFSISHAKDYVVLAFGTTKKMGIDIEFHKERLPTKNMLSFLLPTEQAFIEKSSNPQDVFFTIWTRKEAILKATGEGTTKGFKKCDCTETTAYHASQTWQLHKISIAPNYTCHLALTK